MRTIAKPILFVAMILLVVFAIATLCLNLYLQSQGTQTWLREQLSGIAKTPVAIRGTYALPLGSIWLKGVVAGEGGAAPMLTAESLSIRPDYSELLHGNIVISGVVLDHPVIRITLGQLRGNHETGFAKNSSFGSSALSTPTPIPSQAPAPSLASPFSPLKEAFPRQKSLTLLLRSIKIHGGEFTLMDENEQSLLTLTGIGLEGSAIPRKAWSGRLEATQAVLAGRLLFGGIRSSVSLPEDLSALTMNSFTANLGGGTLAGNALINLNPATPNYSLSLKLGDASIKQLIADASLGSSSAEGNLSGDLTLRGTPGFGASMEGNGDLFCKEATVQPVDFLKQIGQLLNIEELQLLRLAEGKCLFRVEGGHVVIDDLFLRSENLILAAKGPVHPSGELDLESRLLFNEKLTRRLSGLLGSQLSPAPEPGYSQVSFHVSGTTLNPRTDLLERLTGLRLGGNLGGLLQGLFGRPAPANQPPPQPAH